MCLVVDLTPLSILNLQFIFMAIVAFKMTIDSMSTVSRIRVESKERIALKLISPTLLYMGYRVVLEKIFLWLGFETISSYIVWAIRTTNAMYFAYSVYFSFEISLAVNNYNSWPWHLYLPYTAMSQNWNIVCVMLLTNP